MEANFTGMIEESILLWNYITYIYIYIIITAVNKHQKVINLLHNKDNEMNECLPLDEDFNTLMTDS